MKRLFSVFTLVLVIYYLPCFGQHNKHNSLIYLSPVPGSDMVLPQNNIAFRLKNAKDILPARDIKIVTTGNKSKQHSGCLRLADDQRTFIFKPDKPFARGESVSVHLEIINGTGIDTAFSFQITSISKKRQLQVLKFLNNKTYKPLQIQSGAFMDEGTQGDSLPEGFPEITITKWNQPSPGYIFITPLAYALNHYFLIMLDNHNTPVFYRELKQNGATDFKLQPSGQLSYFDYSIWKYIVLDQQFVAEDTLGAGNGYSTDLHELRLFENGHAFLQSYDPQIIDMSQIVPGGYEYAIVSGLIVQELDAQKNVIFQWRSWDHFQITDASDWIDLTDTIIDYVHGNSIEVVSDSELLISSRNMNEITKIDRNTGDIIWRLNGENNMFTFTDPDPDNIFCVQHAIRLMPDSMNISVFDNGNCHNPPVSSAMEFSIDEANMTATLESKFVSDPPIYGNYMGNAQRLLNGNTVNGYGSGIPSVTEFDPEGNVLLEFSFDYLNYRAFKFNWQHEVFHAEPSFMVIDTLMEQDTVYRTFTLTNTSSFDININRAVNRLAGNILVETLPVSLPANGSIDLTLRIIGGDPGDWNDDFTLCWDINNPNLVQRIASQVSLSGFVEEKQGVGSVSPKDKLVIFPNPSGNAFTLKQEGEFIDQIKIYNVNGECIDAYSKINSDRVRFGRKLPPGIFMLKVLLESGKEESIKIIKK